MKNRSRALYLLSEVQCLSPGSGAYHHVQNGLKELGKYYSIKLFILCRNKKPIETSSNNGVTKGHKSINIPLRRVIKWFYLLITRNYDFIIWYFKVKKENPAFIYERASYLNFRGLLISKMLGIPHFYEVNGAFYFEYSKDYPKMLNSIAKRMETFAYNASSYCFFVGTISESFKLSGNNFTSVQNGIERSFVELFSNKQFNPPGGIINIVFVGHAMNHHRLDILTSAFKKVNNPGKFHMHFVGTNYEKFDLQFPPSTPVTYHGSLDHKEIASVLSGCQVGIFPFAVSFSSAVKLFMYGAAKLLLLIPDAKNHTEIFSEEEVFFFKNECEQDLAQALDKISLTPSIIDKKGQKIHCKVVNNFTWDQIFKHQAELMENILINKINGYGKRR